MRQMLLALALSLFILGCDQYNATSYTDNVETTEVVQEPDVAPVEKKQKLIVGNCQWGECAVAVEEDRIVLGKNDAGTLYRLTLLGGSAPLDNDDPKAIVWNEDTHNVFVLCSDYLPALVTESDNQYSVDVLLGNLPAVISSSASIHDRVCGTDIMLNPKGEELDYQIVIDKPEDLLTIAEQIRTGTEHQERHSEL